MAEFYTQHFASLSIMNPNIRNEVVSFLSSAAPQSRKSVNEIKSYQEQFRRINQEICGEEIEMNRTPNPQALKATPC